MPRKKNRKHRKGKIKKPVNVSNENAASTSEKMRTCIETSANESCGLALNFPEPIRTPSPRLNLERTGSPIRTTPVNRCNRGRKSCCGSMNVTNLNILFNTNSEPDISKKEMGMIKRSRSSMAKLHSPGKERPLKVHRSVQVGTEAATGSNLTETPKSSNVFVFQGPCYLNNQFSDVNVNPYLKNKELEVINRNNSIGDFFSPKLFQHKHSSTPIEKIHDYSKDGVDYNFKISKLNLSNNLSIPTTLPKFSVNLNSRCNFNDTSLTDKVKNKENSIRNLKIHTSNASKKSSYRTSPHKSKNLSQAEIKRSRRHSYSKHSNVNQKGDRSFNQIGATEKVLKRLRNYCAISQGWSSKVIDVCSQLGVQLKNSLASLCNLYNDSLDEEHSVTSCKCEEYKQHINELREEMEHLKTEVKAQKNSEEIVEQLSKELKKVNEELAQFKTVCSEFQTLKHQVELLQSTKCSCKNQPTNSSLHPPITPSLSFVPLAPPPPPPPPPPLPPLPSLPSIKTPLTCSNSLSSIKKSKLILEKENARPFISLDDILKVKLKKTSERTPVTRRTLQPMVSIDMLKQVKLRPASRSAARAVHALSPEKTEEATSPHTNLCRLLKHESSVFRLKKLRKSCHSYDSVYRRNSLSKREREYDT